MPASTFKIPHSIIGLEVGHLQDEQTIFYWDGNDRYQPQWEKDLSLSEAFQLSCVPCYQEMARSIGEQRMNKFLDEFQYGQMDVTADNIDEFWLAGKSKIDALQQIDFLSRLYNGQLGISETTTKSLKNILVVEATSTYTLSGKTGLAVTENLEIGWFVGYLQKDNRIYYFAARLHPHPALSRDEFIPARKKVVMESFRALSILQNQ